MINSEKELNTPEDVLNGVQHIIAEMISESSDIRGMLRNVLWDTAVLTTSKSEKLAEGQGAEYKDYFEFKEPIKHIPPHRVLAINRGEKENALQIKLEWDSATGHAIALERLPLPLPGESPTLPLPSPAREAETSPPSSEASPAPAKRRPPNRRQSPKRPRPSRLRRLRRAIFPHCGMREPKRSAFIRTPIF